MSKEKKSLMHLVVSGTKDAIVMVEAGAKEVPEETMLDAIMYAHEYIKQIVEFIEGIVKEVGVPKSEVILHEIDKELEEKSKSLCNRKKYTMR